MSYDVYFKILDADIQRATGKIFTFGYVSAVGVRGPEKLVNRWVHCLLTPKGSDPMDPGYGTECAGLIGTNVSTVDDAVDALAIYIDDCNEQIHALDRLIFPPNDERLQTAELIKVVLMDPDGFQAWVNIKNMAGQKITMALPVVGAAR